MWLVLMLAAQEREARAILEELDAAYRAASSVTYEATVDGKMAQRAVERVELKVSIRGRTHMRMELAFTSLKEPARNLIVATAEDLAEYRSSVHEHRSLKLDKPIDGSLMSDPVGHAYFGGSLAALFPQPSEGAKASWTVSRSADSRVVTLTLEQQQKATAISTFELTVAAGGPAVRRFRTETNVNGEFAERRDVTYGSLALDGPLEDAVFSFAPPEGSRRVEQFSDPVLSRLEGWIGKTLPDVALTASDGRAAGLGDVTRGAVTLVCMWSSANENCLVAVNHFNVVHEQFSSDGVRIVLLTSDVADQIVKFERSSETQPKWGSPIYRFESALPEPFTLPDDFPTTFLLDRGGAIRHVFVGPAVGSIRYSRAVADVVAGP